jgi:5-methylcytosine-specific restriction endonuclease McrA
VVEPARTIAVDDLNLLVDLLDAHGARGFSLGSPLQYRESERWLAASTIFACLPSAVVNLRPGRDKFVPPIRQHLSRLRLPQEERTCLVLKGVAEQIVLTTPALCARHGLRPRRKYGVSDVRALGQYIGLTRAQGGRCATCGLPLAHAENVELDHVIPFALIGDVADGANWRLLCGQCNMGKHEFMSSWLVADAWNWLPGAAMAEVGAKPTLRARYSVLATRGRCEHAECGAGAASRHLSVLPILPDGLLVPSNLRVLCDLHGSSTALSPVLDEP